MTSYPYLRKLSYHMQRHPDGATSTFEGQLRFPDLVQEINSVLGENELMATKLQALDKRRIAWSQGAAGRGEPATPTIDAWRKAPTEVAHQYMICEHDALVAFHVGRYDALKAEEQRLLALIAAASQPWLELVNDHNIPWEGGIDSAMQAACGKIRELLASRAGQTRPTSHKGVEYLHGESVRPWRWNGTVYKSLPELCNDAPLLLTDDDLPKLLALKDAAPRDDAESVAELVFDAMLKAIKNPPLSQNIGTLRWVPSGNSGMQDEARAIARRILALLAEGGA